MGLGACLVSIVSPVSTTYIFAPNSGALQHVQEVEWGRLGHPRSPLSGPRIVKGGKGRAPVLLWVCACLRQQRIIQRAVADKIQRSASSSSSSSSGSGAAQRDGEPVADHCRPAQACLTGFLTVMERGGAFAFQPCF